MDQRATLDIPFGEFAPTLPSVQLHVHGGRASSGHVHTHGQYDDASYSPHCHAAPEW
jgi:hypothetical protein